MVSPEALKFFASLLLVLSLSADALRAQHVPEVDSLAAAEQMLNEGKMTEARAALERYVASHPNDAAGVRLLARALYWSTMIDQARARYEQAMALAIDDAAVRLEYGRFLVENRQERRAREILELLRAHQGHAADAEFLLGLLSYWNGDWTDAVERFEAALRIDARHTQARTRLREIRQATPTLLTVSSRYLSDTQPLTRLSFGGEFAWSITPLSVLTLRAEPLRAVARDSSKLITSGSLGFKQFLPSVHLGIEFEVGAVRRSFATHTDAAWKFVLGLRPGHHLVLNFHGDRSPYSWTLASLSTPVQTTTLGARIEWFPPEGWMGQAGFESVRFPDHNSVQRGSAWLLAPLFRLPAIEMSVGYGVSVQDAQRLRYVPDPWQSSSPGIYAPYYTPSEQIVHSALGWLKIPLSSSTAVNLNVSYGVRASEEAPYLIPVLNGDSSLLGVQTYRRSFHPWNAKGTLDGLLNSRLGWTLEAVYWSTAYYDLRTVLFKLSYRFFREEP